MESERGGDWLRIIVNLVGFKEGVCVDTYVRSACSNKDKCPDELNGP